MAEQSRFRERRAVRGLVLTLDERRGALILRLDESRIWCEFWVKDSVAIFGFHAVVRRHVIHDQPVCAVVYASLPTGVYTIHEPAWTRGTRFPVTVGHVTYADLRSPSFDGHAWPITAAATDRPGR